MRQVPNFLFIGNGRLATHFKHYFSLLSLPFDAWQRTDSIEILYQKILSASHIFLMIQDDAIQPFIAAHLNTRQKDCLLIHFSGCLVIPEAFGAHPLTTFHQTLYDVETYQNIPFLLDENAPDFKVLFPGLPNQHARLRLADKAKYHAVCVLAGNFSCILWQKLLDTFENEFNFKKELAFPYLMQQIKNIVMDATTALTGPLVRRDLKTLEKNMVALENDPFQSVYKSFVSCYDEIKRGDKI